MITIELTTEQFETLAYALGMAHGTAIKGGSPILSEQIRKLWNEIQIRQKSEVKDRQLAEDK